MAKFELEVPKEIIDQVKELEFNTTKMMEEMTRAGAKTVEHNIKNNIKRSFNNYNELLKHLKITKTYKTLSDGAINTKVAFYGYYKTNKKFKLNKNSKNGRKNTYEYNGIPIPLIINAREYGSSHGEKKRPFIRPSFNKKQVNEAMLKIQEKYIKEQ